MPNDPRRGVSGSNNTFYTNSAVTSKSYFYLGYLDFDPAWSSTLGHWERASPDWEITNTSPRQRFCARSRTGRFTACATPRATSVESRFFRDCQIKALIEQSETRAATKVKHAATSSGQGEFFGSLHDMAPDELEAFLEDEKRNAEATLLAMTPKQPGSIPYERLWPLVLSRNVVRLPDGQRWRARPAAPVGLYSRTAPRSVSCDSAQFATKITGSFGQNMSNMSSPSFERVTTLR
jgi:hypothetical protein